ncbi:hypothetical protein J6590_010337 [Homalodisca vitripennis]|nr:hypothetical protein J6590_010337 [Homalodisca vitripennis]
MEVSPKCCCFLVLLNTLFIVGVIVYVFTVMSASTDDQPKNTNSTGPRATDTLRFVAIITRHGNRVPLLDFPDNQYPLNNSKYWPYAMGQVTPYGRVQMYNLGVKIRSLYNGFLDQLYYTEDFYASSTAIDRTLISGEAFLAGLYPPTDFQVWDKNILWQPIPMYSNSQDKTVEAFFCPKFMQERAKNRLKYEEDYAANLSAIYNYIYEHSGVNLTTPFGMLSAWDTFIAEDTEGYKVPDWANGIYPEPLADLVGKMYIEYVAGDEISTNLIIGLFYEELLSAMGSKVNGTLSPDRKMYYYSGHDTSIVTLQAVLGIPKSDIIGMVKPGSALLFELHQNLTTEEYFVQVLYIDGSSPDLEPASMDIPGCSHPCGFSQLVTLTQNFTHITNYTDACQINNSLSYDLSSMKYLTSYNL